MISRILILVIYIFILLFKRILNFKNFFGDDKNGLVLVSLTFLIIQPMHVIRTFFSLAKYFLSIFSKQFYVFLLWPFFFYFILLLLHGGGIHSFAKVCIVKNLKSKAALSTFNDFWPKEPIHLVRNDKKQPKINCVNDLSMHLFRYGKTQKDRNDDRIMARDSELILESINYLRHIRLT